MRTSGRQKEERRKRLIEGRWRELEVGREKSEESLQVVEEQGRKGGDGA